MIVKVSTPIILGLFFGIAAAHRSIAPEVSYIVILATASISFAFWVLSHTNNGDFLKVVLSEYKKSRYFFIISVVLVILVLVSWLYGVLLGIWNGNPIQYVTRNFAGMVLYSIFFILLLVKPRPEAIVSALLYASLFFIVIGVSDIASAGYKFTSPEAYLLYNENAWSLRSSLEMAIMIVFVVVSLSLLFLLRPGYKTEYCVIRVLVKRPLLSFLLSSFVVIFAIFSKGFIFAYMVLITFYVFIYILYAVIEGRRTGLFYVVAFFTLVAGLFFMFLINELAYFSSENVSNSYRSEQFVELWNNSTIYGNGLGATVDGFISDQVRPYGYELTYINLIHKLGIFSIFVFALHFIIIVKIFVNFISRVNLFNTAVAMAAPMTYIIGSGNPTLFSSVSVVLHVIALYLLSYDYSDKS